MTIKTILFVLIFTGLASADEAPLYIKEIIGKPNMAYFDEEQRVAKELGINIKHIFKGCIVRENDTYSESAKNKKADKYYSSKLGNNWKEKLEEATQKRMK